MTNEEKIAIEVDRAARVICKGGIILYPTDTIWGIGCDATNPEAVRRIYELKRRRDAKAMIILADSPAMLDEYVENRPAMALDLIKRAGKPLTIIYEKGRNLAHNLLAQDGSIGIRITGEAFSKSLCERTGLPIVSTSANYSGEPFPGSFKDISEGIRNGVDYVVDYRRGDGESTVPSGIIKLTGVDSFDIIRE
jgi:L-threonylcarbamoyladenylate synthase